MGIVANYKINNSSPVDDSKFIVQLSVAELRQIIDNAIRKLLGDSTVRDELVTVAAASDFKKKSYSTVDG
jgi:hypothetical protein